MFSHAQASHAASLGPDSFTPGGRMKTLPVMPHSENGATAAGCIIVYKNHRHHLLQASTLDGLRSRFRRRDAEREANMSDGVSRNASSPVDAADRNQGSRREFIGAGAFALLAATGSAVVASAEDKPAARTSEGPWTAASSYDVGFRRRAVELR